MEPLLRWLAVGNRGYRPTYQPHKPTSTIITYDEHGYADDMSITARSIQELKIQLKNYTSSANTPAYNSRHPIVKPPVHSGPTASPSTKKIRPFYKKHLTPSPS
jgi:hypothetical protein